MSENIALLGQFGKTLTDPIINCTQLQENRDFHSGRNRLVTFEQEQHPAEAFALLLAKSNNPNTIGAVCIEEQADGSSFIMRTAVDSGSQVEGWTHFDD